MSDSNQIRINELARELEIKAKVLIDFLPQIGVTEKKTHSSSLDIEHAELARKHFRELADAEAAAEAAKTAAKSKVVRPAAAPAKPAAPAPAPTVHAAPGSPAAPARPSPAPGAAPPAAAPSAPVRPTVSPAAPATAAATRPAAPSGSPTAPRTVPPSRPSPPGTATGQPSAPGTMRPAAALQLPPQAPRVRHGPQVPRRRDSLADSRRVLVKVSAKVGRELLKGCALQLRRVSPDRAAHRDPVERRPQDFRSGQAPVVPVRDPLEARDPAQRAFQVCPRQNQESPSTSENRPPHADVRRSKNAMPKVSAGCTRFARARVWEQDARLTLNLWPPCNASRGTSR